MNQRLPGISLATIGLVLLVVLTFVKLDIDAQGAALCQAYDANPELDITSCPAHETRSDWLISVGLAIALLVSLAGAYLAINPYTRTQKSDPTPIDTSKLDADEQAILDVVNAGSGSAYQSDVVKETGFSKVKVSRTLDKLEQKDILERKRRGMTNLVVRK